MSEDRANLAERAALIRKHLDFLRARLAGTEQHWESTPKLFLFAALAVPAWVFYSFAHAALVVALTLGLVGTAAYLRGVRRSETREEIKMLERDLAALEARISSAPEAAT